MILDTIRENYCCLITTSESISASSSDHTFIWVSEDLIFEAFESTKPLSPYLGPSLLVEVMGDTLLFNIHHNNGKFPPNKDRHLYMNMDWSLDRKVVKRGRTSGSCANGDKKRSAYKESVRVHSRPRRGYVLFIVSGTDRSRLFL
jgi:hypothetical protein